MVWVWFRFWPISRFRRVHACARIWEREWGRETRERRRKQRVATAGYYLGVDYWPDERLMMIASIVYVLIRTGRGSTKKA